MRGVQPLLSHAQGPTPSEHAEQACAAQEALEWIQTEVQNTKTQAPETLSAVETGTKAGGSLLNLAGTEAKDKTLLQVAELFPLPSDLAVASLEILRSGGRRVPACAAGWRRRVRVHWVPWHSHAAAGCRRWAAWQVLVLVILLLASLLSVVAAPSAMLAPAPRTDHIEGMENAWKKTKDREQAVDDQVAAAAGAAKDTARREANGKQDAPAVLARHVGPRNVGLFLRRQVYKLTVQQCATVQPEASDSACWSETSGRCRRTCAVSPRKRAPRLSSWLG